MVVDIYSRLWSNRHRPNDVGGALYGKKYRVSLGVEGLREWILKRYLTELDKGIKISSNDRVLDVGCNTGTLLRLIADADCPSELHGIDINRDAIARSGMSNLLYMDAQNLQGFPSSSLDVIVSTATIEHVPDLQRVFGEFDRVLADNGRVGLIYPWEPFRGFVCIPDYILGTLGDGGPRDMHLHRLTPLKIDAVIQGIRLQQTRRWMFWLAGAWPMYISILAKS
jgi:SAM-dependent methyltransferase